MKSLSIDFALSKTMNVEVALWDDDCLKPGENDYAFWSHNLGWKCLKYIHKFKWIYFATILLKNNVLHTL